MKIIYLTIFYLLILSEIALGQNQLPLSFTQINNDQTIIELRINDSFVPKYKSNRFNLNLDCIHKVKENHVTISFESCDVKVVFNITKDVFLNSDFLDVNFDLKNSQPYVKIYNETSKIIFILLKRKRKSLFSKGKTIYHQRVANYHESN